MPDCLWFHVVTAGAALLEVDGDGAAGGCAPASWRWSRTGPGTGCGTPRTPRAVGAGVPHEFVTDRYAIIRHGGGGAGTTLICGAVRFDHPAARVAGRSCCRPPST